MKQNFRNHEKLHLFHTCLPYTLKISGDESYKTNINMRNPTLSYTLYVILNKIIKFSIWYSECPGIFRRFNFTYPNIPYLWAWISPPIFFLSFFFLSLIFNSRPWRHRLINPRFFNPFSHPSPFIIIIILVAIIAVLHFRLSLKLYIIITRIPTTIMILSLLLSLSLIPSSLSYHFCYNVSVVIAFIIIITS